MKSMNLLFKGLLLTMFTIASTFSQAQILFQEDFDGVGGAVSGGAGTYLFPASFMLRNVDNLTPATNVNYVNDAWERREDFVFNTADSCAFSTSWYTPAGISNDWMWTPLIGPLPANCVLKWNAVAYDPNYQDGYEVRIMTSTQGPPTGGAGVIGNQITNSTVVFSTPGELSAWTARQYNLSAYTGQSIYVGFRNNSNDKFILLIDDIEVSVQLNYDAEVTVIDTMEYTMIPLQQVVPFNLNGTIRNNGVNAITNVRLKVNVYDGSFAQVYTNTSTAIASLAAGASQSLNAGSFTPTSGDAYYFEYLPLINETDGDYSNDTLYNSILITDTTYARDDGTVTGSLGIGAGDGFLGQTFAINSATELRSVSFFVTKGYTGRQAAVAIWDMVGGVPSTIIASTDTLLYPDDSARLYTLNIAGGPLSLAIGDYTITAIEFDSTLALGQTEDIFTLGSTWVDWSTNPLGTWGNNEDFGASFSKPYVIRPNLYHCNAITATMGSTDASCSSCPDGTATATPTSGEAPYTYLWSNSASTQTINSVLPGTYNVTITDSYGCSGTESVVVNYTVGIEEFTSNFSVSPNPNNGNFDLVFESVPESSTQLQIVNIMGEIVFETMLENQGGSNYHFDINTLSSGHYYLRLIDDKEMRQTKLIVQ